MKQGRNTSWLFLITLIYFLLPFLHIGLALTGLLCMAIPFILLKRDGRKSWCGAHCPRADYFTLMRGKGLQLRVPPLFSNPRFKQGVLSYFCLNIFFIISSSTMVALGRLAPIDRIRFLIFMEIPLSMPQLLSRPVLSPVLLHLSFRIYSVMFTSLVLGTILALLYRPRTWCRICPVNTLSDQILHKSIQNLNNPT